MLAVQIYGNGFVIHGTQVLCGPKSAAPCDLDGHGVIDFIEIPDNSKAYELMMQIQDVMLNHGTSVTLDENLTKEGFFDCLSLGWNSALAKLQIPQHQMSGQKLFDEWRQQGAPVKSLLDYATPPFLQQTIASIQIALSSEAIGLKQSGAVVLATDTINIQDAVNIVTMAVQYGWGAAIKKHKK